MKVTLTAYSHGGCGPHVEAEIEGGRAHTLLKFTFAEETRSFEVDGLDLWRAVLALMADPEANGLRKNPYDLR